MFIVASQNGNSTSFQAKTPTKTAQGGMERAITRKKYLIGGGTSRLLK